MWDNASGLRIQLDKTCNQSHRDDCMFADSNNKSVCSIYANLESLPQTGSTQDALLTRMDFMLDAASYTYSAREPIYEENSFEK